MARHRKSPGKSGRPGGDRSDRARPKRRDEPIVAYNSKVKLGILALPCIFIVGLGLQGLFTGTGVLGGGPISHLAAALIGGITAFVLLQMAFDQKPVLVLDEDGIYCRQKWVKKKSEQR